MSSVIRNKKMSVKLKARCIACLAVALYVSAPVSAAANSTRADWMRDADYGVFVHYLANAVVRADDIHSDGVARDWNACVDAFDVERFANEMKRAGAGYVMFTLLQGSRFVVAPNAVYDEWFGFRPGEACARRDLPMELADALARRGIDLMLYFTGDGPCSDPGCVARGGFKTPIPAEWVEKWAKVLECFAVRYGSKVKGWWIDGCYVKWGDYGYTPEKLRLYERAIRAGNPQAAIAFNNPLSCEDEKVEPYMPFQDYSAGEKNHFRCLPQSDRLPDGERWHVLTYLGSSWGRPGVKVPARTLSEYVYLVNRAGGALTIDVMCYWDGGLERSQINTLAMVRPALVALREAAARNNDGNLARFCPARCLSLRGTPLPMQRECKETWLAATDGNPGTYIQGCMEWPWQLEVDLGVVREFRKVQVKYHHRNYATRLRLSVSQDGREWSTVSEQDNFDPFVTTMDFPAAWARFGRCAALKPDGEGQTGVQMAIEEIDVR